MTKAHTALKLEEAVKVLEVADAGTFQSSQKTKPEAESHGRQRRTPGGALSSRSGSELQTTQRQEMATPRRQQCHCFGFFLKISSSTLLHNHVHVDEPKNKGESTEQHSIYSSIYFMNKAI